MAAMDTSHSTVRREAGLVVSRVIHERKATAGYLVVFARV